MTTLERYTEQQQVTIYNMLKDSNSLTSHEVELLDLLKSKFEGIEEITFEGTLSYRVVTNEYTKEYTNESINRSETFEYNKITEKYTWVSMTCGEVSRPQKIKENNKGEYLVIEGKKFYI